tara:strand:+ start:201 stop:407 length:207 start_codon:yes stop_codon:yes gene_type:complete
VPQVSSAPDEGALVKVVVQVSRTSVLLVMPTIDSIHDDVRVAVEELMVEALLVSSMMALLIDTLQAKP